MEAPNKPIELTDKVELQSIVQNTVQNNAIHYENRTKLESLQSWIRQQYKLYNADK